MNTTINIPLAAKYNLYTVKYWLYSFGVENIIFLENLLLLVPLLTSISSSINSHDLVFVQIPLNVFLCHLFPFLTSTLLYLVPSHCFVFPISIFFYFPFYVFTQPCTTTVSVSITFYHYFELYVGSWRQSNSRATPRVSAMAGTPVWFPWRSRRSRSADNSGRSCTLESFIQCKVLLKRCLAILFTYVSVLLLFLCPPVFYPLSHFHCKLLSSLTSLGTRPF